MFCLIRAKNFFFFLSHSKKLCGPFSPEPKHRFDIFSGLVLMELFDRLRCPKICWKGSRYRVSNISGLNSNGKNRRKLLKSKDFKASKEKESPQGLRDIGSQGLQLEQFGSSSSSTRGGLNFRPAKKSSKFEYPRTQQTKKEKNRVGKSEASALRNPRACNKKKNTSGEKKREREGEIGTELRAGIMREVKKNKLARS